MYLFSLDAHIALLSCQPSHHFHYFVLGIYLCYSRHLLRFAPSEFRMHLRKGPKWGVLRVFTKEGPDLFHGLVSDVDQLKKVVSHELSSPLGIFIYQ